MDVSWCDYSSRDELHVDTLSTRRTTIAIYTYNRGGGSKLALVWCLSEYIAMLALCKEALAMLVLCNEALAKCVYWGGGGGVWGACPPGKFGFLGFLYKITISG